MARIKLEVYVDLDSVPGVFHSSESAKLSIEALLKNCLGHYNPEVKIASIDDTPAIPRRGRPSVPDNEKPDSEEEYGILMSKIRNRYDWSRQEAANELGITGEYVRQLEQGMRKPSKLIWRRMKELFDNGPQKSQAL